MNDTPKTNKPVDGAQTLLKDAVKSGAECKPPKPVTYKCVPATTYTQYKTGERMNSYRIIGTELPKVGDTVRLTWNKSEFKGSVVEFTNDDTLRLRKV